MPTLVDLRVTELLCSRLCHELVSPVGAVVNGVEMVEEFGESAGDEVIGLISSSAAIASKRLQFYRSAYGMTGIGAVQNISDLKEMTDGVLAENRLSAVWPDDSAFPEISESWLKVFLNLVVLAWETLPKGGELRVSFTQTAGGLDVHVDAVGDGARLSDNSKAAMQLDADVESLSPRTVHAHFTVCLADRMNFDIVASSDGANTVGFVAKQRN